VKVVNLSQDFVRVGWIAHSLPEKVDPSCAGLAATFFLKATFGMRNGESLVKWEEGPDFPLGDLPMPEGPNHGIAYATDYVPFKPRGEFTVVGSGHSPGGPSRAFPVRVRVGSISKTIAVIGDRQWKPRAAGVIAGEPTLIESIPLTYSRAWGGRQSTLNPLGCGRETDEMPNLEIEKSPILERSANVPPAGFAPIPADWSIRREKLGTYDSAWLKERWPWFPNDIDPTYFNAAPANQWFDGYLSGDEEIEITNMHPAHAVYRNRLPGAIGRCFVMKRHHDEKVFLEVPLHLDTLAIDMSLEKLHLVWRGRVPVGNPKLTDVSGVAVGLDFPGTVSPDYRAALIEKIERKPFTYTPPQKLEELAGLRERIVKRMGEVEADINAQIAEPMRQAEELEKEALAKMAARVPPKNAPPEKPFNLPGLIEALKEKFGKSPKNAPPEREAAFAHAMSEAESIGDPDAYLAATQAEFESDKAAFLAKMDAAMSGLKRPKPAKAPENSEEFTAMKIHGLSERDLTYADFSGMDLRGVSFRGSILRGVNFSGAKMQDADLARADLSGANLTGANLDRANLTGVDLTNCKTDGVNWRGACIEKASFRNLLLSGADFSECHGDLVDFADASLDAAMFTAARLPRANFIGTNVEGADFSRAELQNAKFLGARARGSIFHDADLTRFRGGFGADFREAQLQRANGPESIWKGSDMAGANFQQAVLTRSHFAETRQEGSTFDRANLVGSNFQDADLRRAALTNANLFRASLNRADLTDASLDGSNLFGASLWDTVLLHATWERANIKQTRLSQ